jgi:hypothetical protein
MLGLEAPAVERVLADREILSRLETAAENEAFRLAISRYQALPELEQVETGITRDWFYRQEEVARAAVFNELGRSATWRERSSGGHLTSPLITRSPLTLSPGSRPGAVRFDPFWNQTQRGELTYSFDSELPQADVMRLLLSHQSTQEELTRFLRSVPITQAELIQGLEVHSIEQLRAFALRRQARPVERAGVGLSYTLNDLFPGPLARITSNEARMERLLSRVGRHRFDLQQTLARLSQLFFAEQGMRVGAHLDLNVVELTHATYERAPATFARQIETLHSLVSLPSTHLHLGIPARLRNPLEALAVARAVEARVTVKMILQTESGASPQLTYLNSSTFLGWRHQRRGERGLVRFTHQRFQAPTAMHDLEIRQWSSIEEGMEYLSFASELSTRPGTLIPFEGLETLRLDSQAGDVIGALDYISDLLQVSRDRTHQEIARRLRTWANLVRRPESWVITGTNQQHLDRTLRAQLAQELRASGVEQILAQPALYFRE